MAQETYEKKVAEAGARLQCHSMLKVAIFGAAELAKPALIPCFTWLQAALHTPGKPWSRLAPLQGRYHGCEAGPKSPILRLSTPRCQREGDKSLMAKPLQSCTQSNDGSTTGWARTGSCNWDPSDSGYHEVCVTMSQEFLEQPAGM